MRCRASDEFERPGLDLPVTAILLSQPPSGPDRVVGGQDAGICGPVELVLAEGGGNDELVDLVIGAAKGLPARAGHAAVEPGNRHLPSE
jgi:hypothetical protein